MDEGEGMLKLNHEHLRHELAAHLSVDEHWNPHLAYGFAEGVYSMLEGLGFKRWESDRVIIEHLLPGFHAERMTQNLWPGAPYFDHLLNVHLSLISAMKGSPGEDNPFGPDTEEKIRGMYADAAHSKKFWSAYEKEWLPRHEKLIEARRPPASVLGKILKWLSKI